jgi:beta-phosphoglucomutase
MLDRKAAAYRRRIAVDNVLYPGAAACVARLAAAFPLAIASGSLHAEIDAILAVAQLRAPFSAVIGADDVLRGKPAPDPYLAAAAALGIAPQACVAIEDSSWGIDSARAAGMYTIALTTTAPIANLAGANRVVHTLDELSVPFVRALASDAGA